MAWACTKTTRAAAELELQVLKVPPELRVQLVLKEPPEPKVQLVLRELLVLKVLLV